MPSKSVKGSKKNTKKNVSSKVTPSTSKNKVIAILVAAIVVIILLFSLSSCLKSNRPDKLKGQVNQEDKKDTKKKEEKKEEEVVYYEKISNVVPTRMSYTKPVEAPVVEEKDTTAPVITLNGEEEVQIEFMEGTYTEEGAKYTDNKDGSGDIEKPFRMIFEDEEVTEVTNDRIGTYTLFYVYTDAAGNIGTETRTVVVSDTKGPEVVSSYNDSGNTSNSPYQLGTGWATYDFTVTDPSNVATVMIALEDTSVEQNGEWFEANATDITSTNSYTADVNGTYVVYAKDSLGNETFETVEINTVPTGSGSNWTRNVIIGEETDTFSNVKIYSYSSRFKVNNQPRAATEEDFNNPAYQNRISTNGYVEGNNYITITIDNTNSTHWNYFMYDRTRNVDGVDVTETIISGPYCATGVDNN